METCDPAVARDEREDLASTVLEALDTAVLVLSVTEDACTCVTANRALRDRYELGEHADGVRGRHVRDFLAPATAALLEAAAHRALHTGERLAYADVSGVGSPTTEATVVPLAGRGSLVVWTVENRPETPQSGHAEADAMHRLAQESHSLQEANAALSRSNVDLADFAYVASHDLTEPLRMVASHLDFVRTRAADQLDDQAMRSIDFAVEGAERMRALVDALLELAQVTTQPVQPLPVPLGRVLEDALGDLEGPLQEAGATVTVDELPVVHGDRKTLTTVFANLLSNAVKFRSDKPLEIRIGAKRGDGAWRIEVADNGIGIPVDHRAQVFEMFRRLQPRSQHPGTGMGLAICRRVVERHGGELSVDANQGGGSVFAFTLPIPKEA